MTSHQIHLVLVQQFCFVTMSTKPCFCHKKEVNAIIFYKRWYFTTFTSHIIALHRLCIKWSHNEWMQIMFLPFYTSTWTMTAWKMIFNLGGETAGCHMISGAGLCWQHVGGVGSTTTTTWYSIFKSLRRSTVERLSKDVFVLKERSSVRV